MISLFLSIDPQAPLIKHQWLAALGCALISSLPMSPMNAQTIEAKSSTPSNLPAPKDITEWNGYERLNFKVNGRPCLLITPKKTAPGRPWIWRTEFFDHEPQADLALLSQGYHVAYMNVQGLYGAPAALDLMDLFYDYLRREFDLSPKVVLEGFSRGGLYAFNWAARHPERVASIYGDAPVCDFKSWPGGKGLGEGSPVDWKQLLAVYGLTEDEAMTYPGNPVDNLASLAKAEIPILIVYGDADRIVPFQENAALVDQRYRAMGGEIKLIVKAGVGHHPHSLKDPTPILDFILGHSSPSRSQER